MYEFWANAVMGFHTALILAVYIGIVVSVFYKRYRPLESFILLSAIIIWSLDGGCPLTFLENSLRIKAGAPRPLDQTGFIAYYLQHWFGIYVTNFQVTLGTIIIAGLFLLLSFESFNIKILKREIDKFGKSKSRT